MLESRKFYLSLVGVVAWSSTAADTILSILEAASFSSTASSLVNIAAVASAFDAVSLCCIGFYTVQDVGPVRGYLERSGQARKALVAISVLVSITALALSLVLIILIKSRWEEVTTSAAAPISNWDGHVAGQIATWAISCVSQIVLYSSPLWNRKAPKVQTVTTSGPRDSVMSELRPNRPNPLYFGEPMQPSSPLAVHQHPSTLGALPSPTFSSRSSHSLKSFRESLRHVVRPVTSRTTLISQKSFNRDAPPSVYSQRQSMDTVSQSDGFDSWDTSSVSIPARDAALAPSRGTTLEPIPGSRPNSPARALDGPFLSELPEQEEDDEHLAPPPKMMPDVSRPPSPSIGSEAHIHPLFRSESPSGMPPPTATPGTSIMASPLASQAIACPQRPFNRMRSNSQLSQTAANPSRLHQARSFTRDRSTSLQSMSRSPSPPSRAMTPPIRTLFSIHRRGVA